MARLSVSFFQFSALHSLLIGLVPFFIPILLLNKGASFSTLALFIAVTGASFVVSLRFWQKFYRNNHWRTILSISFGSEILLVSLILGSSNHSLFIAAAILNGIYNCFYWTTQRVLFNALCKPDASDTGKQYGTFQIIVVILLKLGITVGAFLLESNYWVTLWLLSAGLSIFSFIWLSRREHISVLRKLDENSHLIKPITLSKKSLALKDNYNSTFIFYLDGIFLFLESYFWVVSLYLLTQENILNLSILIVTLTIIITIIFYLIKNSIDRLQAEKVFHIAVICYAISWGVRATLDSSIDNSILYPSILVIAFLTTFFRLSFNKQFFDIAKKQYAPSYLLKKSYLSQLSVMLLFAIISVLSINSTNNETLLFLAYLIATPVSLAYLAYGSAVPCSHTENSQPFNHKI